MSITSFRSGVALVALGLALAGCASTPVIAPGVTHARCPLGYHTEGHPRAYHWRHAYGCVSDSEGYSHYPGFGRETVAPR